MPIEPLTPADLYDLLPQDDYVLAQGQVYDRGDCAECCWCGSIEPVTWLVPLPDSYVCVDCEAERADQIAGDYAVAVGRVL